MHFSKFLIASVTVFIVIIVIVIIVIILVILLTTTSQKEKTLNISPEYLLLEKLKNDDNFHNDFLKNPKKMLEDFYSENLGYTVTFPDINIIPIEENPKTLYVLIPELKGKEVRPLNPSPLERMVILNNSIATYGMYMNTLDGIWWRLGLHNGSCLKDIYNEVKKVKNTDKLLC